MTNEVTENNAPNPKFKKNNKVLMAVFNPIEYDGRVKRAAETLNNEYHVTIFSPVSMRATKLDLPEEIEIRRAWLYWKKWPTSLCLAMFWLQFIYLALVSRPRIVYSHDFYLPFPGLIAAKIARSLSIYDAHELIIPNRSASMSMRNRIYYWLERMTVRRHDLVIAANSERAELMKQHYRLDTMPVPIRNVSKLTLGCVGRDTILQQYPELCRKDDERLVVYMGDVALARGLGAVIDALDYLPKNISLIVVGDGPDRAMLEERYPVQSNGQKQIRLLGPVPQLWIQDVLSLCEIGVLIYSMEGLNNYYCSPNKIFEYTQAGLPVVATAQPPLVSMVNEYKIGRVVVAVSQNDQPKQFAKAISEVLDNHADLFVNIRRFLEENSLLAEQERLIQATHDLVHKRFGVQ